MIEEKHYRIKEIIASGKFRLCKQTLIKLFRAEPDVPRLPGRRQTLWIPESVVERVYARLCKNTLEPVPAPDSPVGVVLLRDGNGGMVKQTRHVFKTESGLKTSDRKRVP